MNEIIYQGTYNEFKIQMDVEIKEAAAGFVRIGYLLKLARDTSVLQESGYTSVADFAKAEYGLTKDVVSRYIAINDKYSENGYSDQLQEKYRNFGIAKLAEMLTLPDEIADQIPADMTKKEIQEIKRDYKEEQEILDIEVMLEDKPKNEYENNLEKTLYEYFRQQDVFKKFHEMYKTIVNIYENELTADKLTQIYHNKDQIVDIIAPNGQINIRVRIPGTGRMMLVIDEEKDDIVLTNMRSMEKETYGWHDIGEAFANLSHPYMEYEKAYLKMYGEYPEENVEVAPVQQPEERKPEERKPEERKPEERKPVEQKLVEQKPEERKPEQQKAEKQQEPQEEIPEHKENTEEVKENFREVEAAEVEETVEVKQNSNVVRGYMAAVTVSLNRLNKYWDNEENKQEAAKKMLPVLEDLKWRLEQIMKGVNQNDSRM